MLSVSLSTGLRAEGGEWRVEGGGWRVEGREWRVQGGECRLESGGCRVESGGCRVQGAGCAYWVLFVSLSTNSTRHMTPKSAKVPNGAK